MKNFVFLYAGDNRNCAFDRVFSGKSALGRSLKWASDIEDCAGIIVLASNSNEVRVKTEIEREGVENVKIIAKENWNCSDLIGEMAKEMAASKTVNAIYSFADRPFLDSKLTKEILECHEKYIAEYTFAEIGRAHV